MAKGDPVPDEETLVRRFDPEDEDHWAKPDDGGAARLRSLALIFDDSDDGVHREVSVYQDSKLTPDLDRSACLDKDAQDWDVATATVADVKAIRRETVPEQPNPFEVIEDPFPNSDEETMPRDAAHAEIRHALTGKPASKWESLVAHSFRIDSLRDQTRYL